MLLIECGELTDCLDYVTKYFIILHSHRFWQVFCLLAGVFSFDWVIWFGKCVQGYGGKRLLTLTITLLLLNKSSKKRIKLENLKCVLKGESSPQFVFPVHCSGLRCSCPASLHWDNFCSSHELPRPHRRRAQSKRTRKVSNKFLLFRDSAEKSDLKAAAFTSTEWSPAGFDSGHVMCFFSSSVVTLLL